MENSHRMNWAPPPEEVDRPVMVVDSRKNGKSQGAGTYRALSGVSFQDLDMYVRQNSSCHDDPIPSRVLEPMEAPMHPLALPIQGQQYVQQTGNEVPRLPIDRYQNQEDFYRCQSYNDAARNREELDQQVPHSQFRYPGSFSEQQQYMYQNPSYNAGHSYGYPENYHANPQYISPTCYPPTGPYYQGPPYNLPQPNYPQAISDPRHPYNQSDFYPGPYPSPAPYSSNYPYPPYQYAAPGAFMTSRDPREKNNSGFIHDSPAKVPYSDPYELKHHSLGSEPSKEFGELKKSIVLSADSLENIHLIESGVVHNDMLSPISPVTSPRRRLACEYDSLEDLRPKHVSELKTFFENKSTSSSIICLEEHSSSKDTSIDNVNKTQVNESDDSSLILMQTTEAAKGVRELSKSKYNLYDDSSESQSIISDSRSELSEQVSSCSKNSEPKDPHIGDVSFLRATKDTPFSILASTRLVRATMRPPMKPTTFFIALDSKFEIPDFSETAKEPNSETEKEAVCSKEGEGEETVEEEKKEVTEEITKTNKEVNEEKVEANTEKEKDSEEKSNEQNEETVSNVLSTPTPLKLPLTPTSSTGRTSSCSSVSPADYQESQLLLRNFVSDWRCISPSGGNESDIDEFFLVLDSSGGQEGFDLKAAIAAEEISPRSSIVEESEEEERDLEDEGSSAIATEINILQEIGEEEEEEEESEEGEEEEVEEKGKYGKERGSGTISAKSEILVTEIEKDSKDSDTFLGSSANLPNEQPFLGLGKDGVIAQSHSSSVLGTQNFRSDEAGTSASNVRSETNVITKVEEIKLKNVEKERKSLSNSKNTSSFPENSLHQNGDKKTQKINNELSVIKVTASPPEVSSLPAEGSLIVIGKNFKSRIMNGIRFPSSLTTVLPITVSLPAIIPQELTAYLNAGCNLSPSDQFANRNSQQLVPSTSYSNKLCETFSFGRKPASQWLLAPADLEFLASLIANKIIIGGTQSSASCSGAFGDSKLSDALREETVTQMRDVIEGTGTACEQYCDKKSYRDSSIIYRSLYDNSDSAVIYEENNNALNEIFVSENVYEYVNRSDNNNSCNDKHIFVANTANNVLANEEANQCHIDVLVQNEYDYVFSKNVSEEPSVYEEINKLNELEINTINNNESENLFVDITADIGGAYKQSDRVDLNVYCEQLVKVSGDSDDTCSLSSIILLPKFANETFENDHETETTLVSFTNSELTEIDPVKTINERLNNNEEVSVDSSNCLQEVRGEEVGKGEEKLEISVEEIRIKEEVKEGITATKMEEHKKDIDFRRQFSASGENERIPNLNSSPPTYNDNWEWFPWRQKGRIDKRNKITADEGNHVTKMFRQDSNTSSNSNFSSGIGSWNSEGTFQDRKFSGNSGISSTLSNIQEEGRLNSFCESVFSKSSNEDDGRGSSLSLSITGEPLSLPLPVWPSKKEPDTNKSVRHINESSESITKFTGEEKSNNKYSDAFKDNEKKPNGKVFRYVNSSCVEPTNAMKVRRRTLHISENLTEKDISSNTTPFDVQSNKRVSPDEAKSNYFKEEGKEKLLMDCVDCEEYISSSITNVSSKRNLKKESYEEDDDGYDTPMDSDSDTAGGDAPSLIIPTRRLESIILERKNSRQKYRRTKRPTAAAGRSKQRRHTVHFFPLRDSKSLPNLSDVGEANVLDENSQGSTDNSREDHIHQLGRRPQNKSLDVLSSNEEIVPKTLYKFSEVSFPLIDGTFLPVLPGCEEQEMSQLFSDEDFFSDADFEHFSETEHDSEMEHLNLDIFEPKSWEKKRKNARSSKNFDPTKGGRKMSQLKRKFSFTSTEKSREIKDGIVTSLQKFRKAKDKLGKMMKLKPDSMVTFSPSFRRKKRLSSSSMLDVSSDLGPRISNDQAASSLRACIEDRSYLIDRGEHYQNLDRREKSPPRISTPIVGMRREKSPFSSRSGYLSHSDREKSPFQRFFSKSDPQRDPDTPSRQGGSTADGNESTYSWSDADSDFEFVNPNVTKLDIKAKSLPRGTKLHVTQHEAGAIAKIGNFLSSPRMPKKNGTYISSFSVSLTAVKGEIGLVI